MAKNLREWHELVSHSVVKESDMTLWKLPMTLWKHPNIYSSLDYGSSDANFVDMPVREDEEVLAGWCDEDDCAVAHSLTQSCEEAQRNYTAFSCSLGRKPCSEVPSEDRQMVPMEEWPALNPSRADREVQYLQYVNYKHLRDLDPVPVSETVRYYELLQEMARRPLIINHRRQSPPDKP